MIVYVNNRPADGFLTSAELIRRIEGVLAMDQTVFCRDRKLVTIAPVHLWKPKRFKNTVKTIGIHALSNVEVWSRISELAEWRAWKKEKDDNGNEKWVEKRINPEQSYASWTTSKIGWSQIRPLAGIVSAPTMRPDGSLLQTPGWDTATQFYYSPTLTFPAIPEKPTRDDAVAALAQLAKVFARPTATHDGFPFIDEASALVPIAALLTLLARPAIEGPVPAFLFDASTPGSGKTFICDLIAIIATGLEMPKSTFPGRSDELEKMLASMALAGVQICGFDNLALDTPFKGAPLDKVLTARSVQMRILAKSEMPTLTWNAVVLATGNNLLVLGDTVRRALKSRLEPAVERPEERTNFEIPNLKGYAREHRAELVVAAMTILSAYVAAGRPSPRAQTWGSFEDWHELIAGAIEWVSGVDVTQRRVSLTDADEDPEMSAMTTIVEEVAALNSPATVTQLLDLGFGVVEPEWNGKPRIIPPEKPEFGEAIAALVPGRTRDGRPSARAFGKALARHRGRVFAGLRLQSSPSAAGGGSLVWSAMPVPGSGVSGFHGVSFHGSTPPQL